LNSVLFGYCALRKICACIPPGAAKVALNGLSWLYWKLDVRKRPFVIENLKVLSHGTTKDLRILQREVYRHFAYFFYEFFSQRPSKFENSATVIPKIKAQLGEPGEKAGLLLVSHTGNWEASLKELLNCGYPVTTVVMPHSHPDVNCFFDQLRGHPGLETASLKEGLTACAHAIKNKRIIALACERDYTGTGLPIGIFGHEISFPKGPAWLMLRYQVPTFLVKSHRIDLLHFSVELEPVNIPLGLTKVKSEALESLSQHIVEALFKHVLLHAEQWITFDPLFKRIEVT
jgi:Kdo2-lipid IVA lauroyltransferase/acyltransferase